MHLFRTLSFALTCATGPLAVAATVSDQGHFLWRLTTVDVTGGESPSLAFTAYGTPAISYYNQGLRFAQLSGTTWFSELVDQQNDPGRHSSLVLGSDGWPVIAYHGDPPGTILRLAQVTFAGCGYGWSVSTIHRFQSYRIDSGEALTPSLALGSDGQWAIAFFDSTGGASAAGDGDLRLAQSSNAIPWSNVAVDSAGYTGWAPSLAFGPDRRPAIAYHRYDSDRTHGELRLARSDGAKWTATTIDTADGSASLAFGKDGQPAIAYSTGDSLRLARFNGATWTIALIDSAGHSPSLAFGPDGEVVIAYVGNDSVRLARLVGSTWLTSSVDTSFGGREPSLAIARDGRVAIAYGNRELRFAEMVPLPPAIILSPQPRTTVAGDAATLSVDASGIGLTYEWRLNGVKISGATGSSYVIPSAQSFHAGSYTVVVSNAAGSVASAAANVTVNAPPISDSRLLNVSNRGLCGVGDQVLIAGFVVSAKGPKTLLVRAVGPTLSTLANLSDTQPDPQLTIYRREPDGANTLLLSNDDWGVGADAAATAAASAQVGAFALPADSRDAAFVVTLPPGIYTAIARGNRGEIGTALVEVYEVR